MSVQVSLASDQPQTPKATPDYVNRRCANFSPSIWGFHFLSYASVETNIKAKQRAQELKEKVKMIIMAPVKKPSQKLDLIDDIQRLGVSHHFENEIEELLQQIHNSSHDNTESGNQETDNELYIAALRFRLLRQQDIFNNFKDGDGKFKESLVNDVVGLLSLYEATHLRNHGEDILDEALTFTTTHLESANAPFKPHTFETSNSCHVPAILEGLAKARNKALPVSLSGTWWKDLDFVNKLPFARDRVVESYFWASGVHFEPQYYFARRTLCKVLAVLVIIDDIYDVYGTHEELELFTEAVERWDISAMDYLPEYMKVCNQALLDVYVEIEENLANAGNLYRIHYARETVSLMN
ncbi:hypothetical protein CerSpe_156050 [Prunus speciosa]